MSVKRFEVFHVAEVILHLFQGTHAAQDSQKVILAGNKTQRPGRVGEAVVLSVKNGFDGIDRISQDTAFDRFHDNDRFAVLFADLIVSAGLHAGILPVSVVDLQLDEFRVRMLFEQFHQQFGISMEGEAVMPDQTFFLQLLYIIPDAVFFIFLIVCPLNGMDQIIIEITGAAAFQTGSDFLFRFFFRDIAAW